MMSLTISGIPKKKTYFGRKNDLTSTHLKLDKILLFPCSKAVASTLKHLVHNGGISTIRNLVNNSLANFSTSDFSSPYPDRP